MCALRCQLTVRIEGGTRDQHQAHQLEPSLFFVRPLHVISSNPTHSTLSTIATSYLCCLWTSKKSSALYLQELHRMSVRQKVGLYHIELPGECMSLCVYVCVTYVSLGVSSSWQPHTASSTQLHRTTHGERARTRGRRPLLLPTFAPTECIGCITHMHNASTIASHKNTITLTNNLQPCTTNKHSALPNESHKSTVPLFPEPLHMVGADAKLHWFYS